MIKEKKCSICDIVKSINEFGKNKSSKIGYRCECLECRRTKRKRIVEELPEGQLKCFTCKEIKKYDDFHINKAKKSGYNYSCKICTNLKNKENWIKKHGITIKEILPEKHKRCGKCKIIKSYDKYYKNKNRLNGIDPICKECRKNCFDKNKRREYINNWTNEYNKKNPHKVAWRNLLKHTLERLGKSKESKTIEMLGYSALELKEYIESKFTVGMSWDNYGEWHIDHIKPMTQFNENSSTLEVNALINLQPLWATSRTINGIFYLGNLNKQNKYE